MKLITSEMLLFITICVLLWFVNKQHDHIVYLEDTIKIQDTAIQQQTFLIECQKIVLDKQANMDFEGLQPFYKQFD
jgi:hypothetical protein